MDIRNFGVDLSNRVMTGIAYGCLIQEGPGWNTKSYALFVIRMRGIAPPDEVIPELSPEVGEYWSGDDLDTAIHAASVRFAAAGLVKACK